MKWSMDKIFVKKKRRRQHIFVKRLRGKQNISKKM